MSFSTGWRDQIAVKVEATPGVPVPPTTTDTARVIESPSFSQPKEFLITQERFNSLSIDELIEDKSAAGTFGLRTYIKPSGTAGTAPAAAYDAMLEGVFGRKVTVPATSVTYSPLRISQDTRKSYTIFYAFGDGMVLQMWGCVFRTLDLNIRARGLEGILQGAFGGGFMRRVWAGRALTAAGSTTTSIVLAAGGAQFFYPGAYITVTGFTPNPVQISAVDYGTDTLTVPALSGAPGAGIVVAGFFPAATDSGHKVAGWRGLATLGGNNFRFTEADVHLENTIDVIDDQKDGTDFASDFIEGVEKRMATIRVRHYFNNTIEGGMGAWSELYNKSEKAMLLPVGDVPGRIVTVSAPIVQHRGEPTPDTAGKVYLDRNYQAKASAAQDDELHLIFT